MNLTLEKVKDALHEGDLDSFLNDTSLQSLLRFTHRMLEINKTLNLTKWTRDEDILNFHFVDSAVSLPLIQDLTQKKAQRWMDLGSGCGFPGAILAAAFPALEVTLVDSVAKKVKALQECVQSAEWKVKTLQARAEELGRNLDTREKWDGLVARAVADLPVLLEYALPLLKVGGYLVNWMTKEQVENLDKSKNAFQILHAKIVKTLSYSLPGASQNRALLIVEKMGKTPDPYPRFVGIPKKNPL